MSEIIKFFKKELMFTVSLILAILSLFITKPDTRLLQSIDYKTLCILFMLLSVLDGFKHEGLFDPVIKAAKKIRSIFALSVFLIFAVFISSAFVTNDVSLIIFVPLTILLFKEGNKEKYILPVITMENIAAVRGSLITPFGSPQNLYLFSKSGIDITSFLKMMFPLFAFSAVLLFIFIICLYRKDLREEINYAEMADEANDSKKKFLYLSLFIIVVLTIVTRTIYWPLITVAVALILFIFDRKVFRRVDYVLLLTFLCFFIFSSSIANNELIGTYLNSVVRGNEYWWSIGLSQIISNVPASIVLWPFTSSLKALIYGLDSAGLITVIGSLASVINMRLYTNDYPGKSVDFMMVFMKISIIFFILIQPFQLYLLSI
ncbi:MAG: SLC13 family permease [Erysipelotrichaceae bacterium]|nr:SLC13 family permease [Erysipelotrichaceae bacterium]